MHNTLTRNKQGQSCAVQKRHLIKTQLFKMYLTIKNLHQADLVSPDNSYAGMKPKNSCEKVPETQRYFENSNCCITVDKLFGYCKQRIFECMDTP